MKTPSGVEIIPVNGDVENASADAQKRVAATAAASDGKGSKLESALDRLGFNKRKVSVLQSSSIFIPHSQVINVYVSLPPEVERQSAG